MKRRILVVGLALTFAMAALIVPAGPVAASHWCTPLSVSVWPLSGQGGETVNLSITVRNENADSLDVISITAVFGWSSMTWDWGGMRLSGYTSDTNTRSIQLPSAPGDYSLSVTVNGTAVGDTLVSSCGPFTGAFRVGALPPAPRVTATVNPTSGTAPLAATLSASVSDGLPPFSYAWAFGDGTYGSGNSTTHTYSTAGTYTAQVVVTDNRSRTASDNATLTVTAQIPALTATAAVDATLGRVPFRVAFNASGFGGQPPYSYSWTFGDGGASIQQNPSHTYVVPGSYTVIVVISDSGGATVTRTLAIMANSSPIAGSGQGVTPWLGGVAIAAVVVAAAIALLLQNRKRS